MGELIAFSLKPTPKQCRFCKTVLQNIENEFCDFACQNNWHKKYIDDQKMIIQIIRNKCSQFYLTTEHIWLESVGELIPIALFMCVKCNKPISHMQFNWSSGVCGGCDSARTMPKWKIEVPRCMQEKKLTAVVKDGKIGIDYT